jgi:16S rRNA (uracil1498-N3)-methyltransferase
VDGCGWEYRVSLESILNDRVEGTILERSKGSREPDVRVTLAQALTRPPKFDIVVEKTTELGVHTILPVITERSMKMLHTEKLENRRARWQKIAIAAMKQSKRAVLPRIEPAVPFGSLLAFTQDYDVSLVAWEGEKETDVRNVLRRTEKMNQVLILTGPEEGFSRKEVEQARDAGFLSFSLGPRRLRTETAGIVSVSLVMYELGELNPR